MQVVASTRAQTSDAATLGKRGIVARTASAPLSYALPSTRHGSQFNHSFLAACEGRPSICRGEQVWEWHSLQCRHVFPHARHASMDPCVLGSRTHGRNFGMPGLAYDKPAKTASHAVSRLW
eukprot:365569-Chlamydomonas_euryale.AAC.30